MGVGSWWSTQGATPAVSLSGDAETWMAYGLPRIFVLNLVGAAGVAAFLKSMTTDLPAYITAHPFVFF